MNRWLMTACATAVLITGRPVCGQTVAFRGTLVTPTGVIDDGIIGLNKNVISSVQPWSDQASRQVDTVVFTDGVIFPGLIDLHNHITWNALPRWRPPHLTQNRYEWQEMPDYLAALSGPHGELVSGGHNCDLNRYGELKALINGATSTVGSIPDDCIRGLARNLDFLSELTADEKLGEEPFRNEIFPFEIRSSCGEQAMRDVGRPIEPCALNPGEAMPSSPRATVAHVAEGIDASARREFAMFAAHGYLHPGASIIHGVGLHASQFHQMASAGTGLIWSPRSNMELYGATTDVTAARSAGVSVAIAPDWSPSGSTGMLAELRYIDRWQRDKNNPPPFNFSSKELVDMATVIPARLAHLDDRIGKLTSGSAADLIVMRRPQQGDAATAYDALIRQTPGDLLLVIVGGTPVYGDLALMKQLVPDTSRLETIDVCGETRAINARAGTFQTIAWSQTETALKNALQTHGLTLAPFVECGP